MQYNIDCFHMTGFFILKENVIVTSQSLIIPLPRGNSIDRTERHDLKSRLWLFFYPFLFPLKKEGRRKGERIAKIVILSHAFLLDHK